MRSKLMVAEVMPIEQPSAFDVACLAAWNKQIALKTKRISPPILLANKNEQYAQIHIAVVAPKARVRTRALDWTVVSII